MLKYLIILLDDTSVSFCHYNNDRTEPKLIAYDNLKKALVWAMKENLMVQFVYPPYELPDDYISLIDTVDHVDISANNRNADIKVYEGIRNLAASRPCANDNIVLRCKIDEFCDNVEKVASYPSLTIVFTDAHKLNDITLNRYKDALTSLSGLVFQRISAGETTRINLVTDRMQLTSMNNCSAGDGSITIAPDGNFYICPAFYYGNEESAGNPESGLKIPNQQLYRLDYAPLCRNCDAYNCKRCVWLNKTLTHEVNTPGREQCIMAHLERNASRALVERLKSNGIVKSANSIPKIDYLDPFDKLQK